MTPAEHSEFNKDSVEGRFGHLETEVTNLKHGQESLERQMGDGFRAVFARFDSISTSKAAGLLPQLALGITMAGLFAAMIYVYLGGQTAMFGQQMISMSNEIRDTKAAAVSSLRDVNDRMFSNQFEKGEFKQTIVDFRARLLELSDKLQKQTESAVVLVEQRTKAIDEKIKLSFDMQQKVNDAAYANKEELSTWRLGYVKDNAYSKGLSDAKIDGLTGTTKTLEERQYAHRVGHLDRLEVDSLREQQRLVEERQYMNTGKISELDWLRAPGQKDRLDGTKKP